MKFDIRKNLFDAPGDELDEAASRKYIDTLFQRFLDSPEAEALPGSSDRLGWVNNLLGLGIDFRGVTPPNTTPADLHTLLFELFPRKVAVKASEAAEIVQELRGFWTFLQREYRLDNAAACLEVLGGGAVERLEAALGQPDNFGLAKQFAMFSEELGLDLTTEQGRAEAMQAYNATLANVASIPPSGAAPPSPVSAPPQRGAGSRSKSRRKAARASRKKNRRR